MDLDAMSRERQRLSDLIDRGNDATRKFVEQYADAERDYRRAKAEAWLRAPQGTVPERDAWVQGQTADLRHRRDVAEGLKRAAFEAVQSRKAQLSAWQTEVGLFKEELTFAKYGPEMSP